MKSPDYVSFPKIILILIRSRLEALFIWTWCTAISCLIAGRGFPPVKATLMSIFGMFFISMSVYFYNDVIDKEMDKLNPIKKNRPLASNIVSEKDVIKFIYLSGLIGLTINLTLNIYSFIFSFAYLFLFAIYSYPKIRLKNKFLGKELIIFLGWPLCGLVACYAVIGSFSITVFVSAVLFGIFGFLLLPIFADSLDMKEDMLYGVKSLAIILSWKRKIQLLIFAILFIMTITPLTYVQLGFNVLLPIIVVAMSLLLLRFMFPIMKGFEQKEVLKAKKIAYAYFLLLQLVVVFGTLNLNLFI